MTPKFTNHERCRQLKSINKLSALLGTTPQLASSNGDSEVSVHPRKQTQSQRLHHPSIKAPISIQLDGVKEEVTGHSSVRRRFKNLSISVLNKDPGSSAKKSVPDFVHSSEAVTVSTPYVNFANYQTEKSSPITPIDSPLSPFSAYSFDPFTFSSQAYPSPQDGIEELEVLTPISLSREHTDDFHAHRTKVKKMAKLRRHLGECPPAELVFSGNASRSSMKQSDPEVQRPSYSRADVTLPTGTPEGAVSSPRLSSVVQEIGTERLVVESRKQLMQTLRQM